VGAGGRNALGADKLWLPFYSGYYVSFEQALG